MSNLATIVNNILADSGIDDLNVVVTTGSYNNPAWITALSWSKITGTPTTLAGYGITDAYTKTEVNNIVANYLPLSGGTMTGTINSNVSYLSFVSQSNGTSAAWRGIIATKNSSADISTFIGNYTGRGGVFGHTNALDGWNNLWVNTLGIYGQGNVYLSWFTYVKGNGTDTEYPILHSGNYTNYAVQTTTQSNWNSYNVIANVVGLLAWKNYGSNHVIFDASASTSPSGTSISNTDSQYAWAPAYPTLMGWNGGQTYGVRVDRARLADNADTVDGFHATNAAGGLAYYASNGYLYAPAWINVDNGGIFSGTNSAHFRPNPNTYGPWLISGSRNNYSGLEFDSLVNGNVALSISTSSNITGFYNTSYGWQFFWNGGTMYVYKNSYGGGAQATVLDSTNFNTWAAALNGNTGQSFGVFELTYAQTQFNPSLAPRTGLNPMSIKMWDNYFAGIGLGSDYGTVLDYYGRSGHVNTQVYFDASGGSWYRTASYAAGWQGWQKYVTENGATWNISISGGSATSLLLTSSGSYLTQYGSGTVGYVYALASNLSGLFPASDNSNSIITVNRHPGDYYSQLGFSSNGEIYYRRFSATVINTTLPWVTLLTSNNYNSYAPTLTGGGASGTWNISITGSSGSVSFNNLTDKTGGTGTYQTSGDFRAPVFYDSDDTSYYLNPNGGSVLYYLQLNAAESMGLYGIRGRFTNEYIHLYNKVGIGNPSGWGSGETATPLFGFSTWGGNNFAYGNGALSTFNGQVNIKGSSMYVSASQLHIGQQSAGTAQMSFESWGAYTGAIAMNSAGAFTFGGQGASSWNWKTYCTYNGDYTTSGNTVLSLSSGGSLVAVGDMRSPIFYDSSDTSYYLDPNSTSNLYTVNAVNFRASNAVYFGGGNNYFTWNGSAIASDSVVVSNVSMRAPIFYDSNDTTYYVDPNATSNIYKIRIGNSNEIPGLIGMGAGYLYGMGISNAYTAVHAHPSANGVALGSFDGTTFTSKFYVNHDGNAYAITGMYAPIFYDSQNTAYYLDPSNFSNLYSANFASTVNFASATNWFGGYGPGSGPGIGLENQGTFARFAFWGLDFYDWNDGIMMTINNGYVSATSSFRAPIFYDSQNTDYYIDPNLNSNLWNLRLLNGKWYTVNNESGNSVDIYVRPNGDNTYVWRHIYGGSSTGYGVGAGGYGIYNQTLGGDYSAIFSSSGFVTFPYSVRSPIFYDSANTNYYLDPNGASVLDSVTTIGRIYSNEWIQFSNYTGLYSPNNGAHFRPNTGSYGPWLITGTRNGWSGIEFESLANGNVSMMIGANSNETGFHNNSYGWQFRWTTGTMYVFKGTYGGGTQATVWDSVNAPISVSATPNTLALRSGDGDIAVRELTMTVGVQSFTPSSMVGIYPTTNQAVKVTASGTRDFLNVPTRTGGDASGTWNISIYGSAATATSLTPNYAGDRYTNPQVYFNNTIGLKVAMTGMPYYWCDTLWINGYSGGDVLSMCALHTSRDGYPRMWITSQNSTATSYGTFYQFLTEFNYLDYAVRTTNQSNWNSYSVIANVVGLLAWKNYGNSHVIFDASATTSPSGGSINRVDAQNAWAESYPTLMGWNGSQTYGVRVDSSRYANIADTLDGYHEYAFMRYYGYSTSGNFQTFQATPGRLRFDQVGDIGSGAWSNAPTGIYTYGGVLSYRGDSFGLQIYASHTGGMVYKTQWNDDQYSGWQRILDTQNYTSYAAPNGGVLTNIFYFQSNLGSYCGSLSNPPLQVYSTGNNSAFFSFHKSGVYAVNMGLDADNVLRIGGWSAAADRWVLDMNGNNTVAGNMTAVAFFESSDKRLKKIVDENYRLESITSIKPKFYEKNGRLEAGYIAQEVQEIYAHAVQEGVEGYLNLSYGQVHTLKIANLEDSVDEIKKKIKELEEKLNSLY